MKVERSVIKELTKKHFPFEKFNPGQEDAIIKIVESFLDGRKHVILSGPTGIGKSIVATTVHRVLFDISTNRFRTTIITSTKSLQDQYTDNDKEIVDLRGKTNYSCPFNKGPYNSGSCRSFIAQKKCVKVVSCPYVKRRKMWTDIANLRITNSSFQIEACPMICMTPETQADLIVVDECHEIDDLIIEHTSIELNLETYVLLRNYGGSTFLKSLANYINLFKKLTIGQAFNISEEMYDGMLKLNDDVNELLGVLVNCLEENGRDDKELIGDLIESLQQIQDKTQIFDACDQRKGTWILQQFTGTMVEIKPVYAWQVSQHALFRKAEFFLHMSATICGVEEYTKNLGVKDYVFIDLPNPIPVDNRQVFVVTEQKISGNYDVRKLTRQIDDIVDSYHGYNGIIHSVSYKLANEIYEESRHKKNMLVSGDRADIVEFLRDPKKGRVVLSPSLVAGFDAKGDMARFQILPKVPFKFLGDPLVALNSKIRPKWYGRKAILSLVQSSGRAVRGIDDFADTYILDENFHRLFQNNREVFPDWFIDSLNF